MHMCTKACAWHMCTGGDERTRVIGLHTRYMGVCIDACIDACVGTSGDACIDLCVDKCVGMRVDMRMDMARG